MKKLLSVLLSIALIFCFCSCGNKYVVPETGEDFTTVNIGFLGDISSLSIASMMCDDALNVGNYTFKRFSSSDMLISAVKKGNIDVALLSAEDSCKAYKATNKKVNAIDVCAYSAIDFVSANDSIKALSDLKGKTVYISKDFPVQQYIFEFLMDAYSIDKKEINVKYKSNSEDVILSINDDYDSVGVVSKPFSLSACEQNKDLKIIIDCNKMFKKVTGCNIISGVAIVRQKFLNKHPSCVENFLIDHENSVYGYELNPDSTYDKAVSLGMFDITDEAEKLIPKCSLAASSGDVMKRDLLNYIKAINLFNDDIVSKIPPDEFYYIFD